MAEQLTGDAYKAAVERGLEGMEAVSTGVCPGCLECMDSDGIEEYDAEDEERAHEERVAEHGAGCESGDYPDEGSFSWSPCGICGSRLGGDRYRWHWRDPDRRTPERLYTGSIHHEGDACTDCVVYLANGDVPRVEA